MFIIRGHAGVMSGAKISARPSNPGINVNTVLRVNRHSGTITSHRYNGDIIKREATNGSPFENRGKAATLYSITLDLFFSPTSASYFLSSQSISATGHGLMIQTQFILRNAIGTEQIKKNQQDAQSKTTSASQRAQIN